MVEASKKIEDILQAREAFLESAVEYFDLISETFRDYDKYRGVFLKHTSNGSTGDTVSYIEQEHVELHARTIRLITQARKQMEIWKQGLIALLQKINPNSLLANDAEAALVSWIPQAIEQIWLEYEIPN